MNENTQELGKLAEDLGHIENEFRGILGKEPELAHKLHDTADTARRRVRQVNEGNPQGPISPHQGFVR